MGGRNEFGLVKVKKKSIFCLNLCGMFHFLGWGAVKHCTVTKPKSHKKFH